MDTSTCIVMTILPPTPHPHPTPRLCQTPSSNKLILGCSKLDAASMDTITCLSVTKWIHLHGGDDVMRAFFLKVKEVLYPGGYFIVEPQPWKSYKAADKKLVNPPPPSNAVPPPTLATAGDNSKRRSYSATLHAR